MIVLIGSQALEEHIVLNRTPVDTDFIGEYNELVQYAKNNGATSFVPFNKGKYVKFVIDGDIVEAEVAWPGSSAEAIMNHVLNDSNTSQCGIPWAIPSLDVLYMIKMAHRFKKDSPHFLKTMEDIHLMRAHGAQIEGALEDLYRMRQNETYDYGHPKLNQNKDSFFSGDGVTYVYDHDSIHEVIKVHEKPAYEYFKKPGEQVLCSKKLFMAADISVQLAAVYEEACVLAIERSLVPFPGHLSPQNAFKMALMKVCTSITSGWFRAFAWEHYYEVIKLDPQCSYWEKFQRAVSEGKVPLHKP